MQKKVLILGDIILDRFVKGSSTRISQEAPVPVIDVHDEVESLGGAGNLARNLTRLLCTVDMICSIGKDSNGLKIKQLLDQEGINATLYELSPVTTVKTRIIARGQQVVRVDHSQAIEDTSEVALPPLIYDAVVISDYGLGMCSDQLTSQLLTLCHNHSIPCFVDPRGKSWTKYTGATLVKPNLRELRDVLGRIIDDDHATIVREAKPLIDQYKVKHIAVTRGSQGISYIGPENDCHIPTEQVDLYDVTGAGDTTMAAIVYAMMDHHDIKTTLAWAARAGSYVVFKPNTHAINIAELLSIKP